MKNGAGPFVDWFEAGTEAEALGMHSKEFAIYVGKENRKNIESIEVKEA